MNHLFRQGDVPLVSVSSIPASAVALPRQGLKTVLALGEATGHHHRFESNAATMLRDADGRDYLRIDDAPFSLHPAAIEDAALRDVRMSDGIIVRFTPDQFVDAEMALSASKTLTVHGALLVHEEHAAIVIAPGTYAVPGQREYTSADMEPIRVAD